MRLRSLLAVAALAGTIVSPVSVLASAGDLDSTFGFGGRLLSSSNSYEGGMGLQSSGKIILGLSGPGFAVTRYDTDGALDASFASGAAGLCGEGSFAQ